MSQNLIRIQARDDKRGYSVQESGFGEGAFLPVKEFYYVKVGNLYLICNENRSNGSIKFGNLEKDISSTVVGVSPDSNYVLGKLLALARNDANKILALRNGFVLQDLTQQ